MSLIATTRRLLPVALVLLASTLAGCLTAERKIMQYQVKPDGSGTGRITFYNLMSTEDDGQDVSLRDYNELVNSYLKGDRFSRLYPELQNLNSRVYEQNGLLHGEVTFDFLSHEDVGIYRYQGSGPYMYHVGTTSDIATERYASSNGEFAGARLPVIFWPADSTRFEIVADIGAPSASSRSLVALFRRHGVN